MLRRWAEAIAELNPALAVLHARNNPDDEHLLLVRQQRGVCLHALGRASEAAIEFDGILAATAHWPRDHRLVTTVLRQRAELTSAAAAG